MSVMFVFGEVLICRQSNRGARAGPGAGAIQGKDVESGCTNLYTSSPLASFENAGSMCTGSEHISWTEWLRDLEPFLNWSSNRTFNTCISRRCPAASGFHWRLQRPAARIKSTVSRISAARVTRYTWSALDRSSRFRGWPPIEFSQNDAFGENELDEWRPRG